MFPKEEAEAANDNLHSMKIVAVEGVGGIIPKGKF